jgi:hypothetical protein
MRYAYCALRALDLERAINLPQAFDMFDKLARPISRHNREKEYPAFHVWTPISRHRWIMA